MTSFLLINDVRHCRFAVQVKNIAIIDVKNLHKNYGKTIADKDNSFDVHEGEIFGMIGPNGAGKTTTIECIEELRKPDQGSIRVLGVDPQIDSHTLCLYTGMQLQQSSLPDHMKVWEALDLYSSFYPHPVDFNLLIEQLVLAIIPSISNVMYLRFILNRLRKASHIRLDGKGF